jgi:hypothetical protein
MAKCQSPRQQKITGDPAAGSKTPPMKISHWIIEND